MISMFDSINVGALPATAQAIAGYVGGWWPTYNAAKARFPNIPVLSIAVNASEQAECLDVENGDATIAQAPGWVRAALGRGVVRPVVYTSLSNVGALLRALTGAGIARSEYRLWTAHYTYREHLCSSVDGCPTSADATQWTDTAGGCDQSLVADTFFAQPVQPATVPPPIVYPGDNMQIVQASVLIKSGGGWIPFPAGVNAANFVSCNILDTPVPQQGTLPIVVGISSAPWAGAPNGGIRFGTAGAESVPDGVYGLTVASAS